MKTNSKNLKNQKGFTLIELLVVISIIGVISTMGVVALTDASKKARDAKRLSDVSQIRKALQIYHLDRGNYPNENSSNGSWEHSTEDGGDFIDYLKDYGYMGTVPVDPINNTLTYYYSYYRYPAGCNGCDASKGEFYVLGIRNMETSGRPHPQSPGWSCPGRDWQNEFDWVIGRFRK